MTATLRGVWAALRTPLWLDGGRWSSLLRPAAHTAAGEPPARALRVATWTLRALAWPPRSPWRNTCLYRSVASCLVLRGYGVDARLRIGVKTEGGEVVAHAWVVRGDQPDAEADAQAASLQPLAARA